MTYKRESHLAPRGGIPRDGLPDRRGAPRYAANGLCQAWLGWFEGGEQRNTPAEIVNLSMTGALVKVVAAPPAQQPVWLRLEQPQPSDWFEATIVEVRKRCWRKAFVRLALKNSCPYDVFTAALKGFREPAGRITMPGDPRYSGS